MLDFTEMSKMLPETWLPDHQEAADTTCRPSWSASVTDILLWTVCFSQMAAVLAEHFPDKHPQLLTNLKELCVRPEIFRAWPDLPMTGMLDGSP